MFKLVYVALNVRPEEQQRAILLLGLGFFMGIFLATYQLASETQLITQAGSSEDSSQLIRQGLFAAALLGVITTGLFAFFQNKISYGIFSVLNLIAIFIVVSGFYVLHRVLPEEYMLALSFAQFATLGPVVAVFLLGFWGVLAVFLIFVNPSES